MGRCDMCWNHAELRHIELYVFGSEGVNLCHECEMDLNKYVENRAKETMRQRRDEALARKQL